VQIVSCRSIRRNGALEVLLKKSTGISRDAMHILNALQKEAHSKARNPRENDCMRQHCVTDASTPHALSRRPSWRRKAVLSLKRDSIVRVSGGAVSTYACRRTGMISGRTHSLSRAVRLLCCVRNVEAYIHERSSCFRLQIILMQLRIQV